MNHAPLSNLEIVSKVDFFDAPPAGITQPALDKILRFLQETKESSEITGSIAVWSDGTWAMLAHDPAWSQPRPQQLLRAYRSAFAAGIQLPKGLKSVISD